MFGIELFFLHYLVPVFSLYQDEKYTICGVVVDYKPSFDSHSFNQKVFFRKLGWLPWHNHQNALKRLSAWCTSLFVVLWKHVILNFYVRQVERYMVALVMITRF